MGKAGVWRNDKGRSKSKKRWVKKIASCQIKEKFANEKSCIKLLKVKKLFFRIFRPWSFKPVIDITGWYFLPVILFLSLPDKFIYSASINLPIGNTLMKPITDCKHQEQDYTMFKKKKYFSNIAPSWFWTQDLLT